MSYNPQEIKHYFDGLPVNPGVKRILFYAANITILTTIGKIFVAMYPKFLEAMEHMMEDGGI